MDLGKITVPSKWEEVTLKQWQELSRYYSDKDSKFNIDDVLHIFTDKTKDEIYAMPIQFTEKIMNTLSFLSTEPKIDEPRNYVTINDERYIVNVQEQLKTGEYVSVTEMMKQDQFNFALFLAILCRKEGEAYDAKYENEILPSRVEMFENEPFINLQPIINFFLNSYMALQIPTQLSSQIRAEIDHIRRDLEIGVENGDYGKRFFKRQMKTLRKLEKSINSI